jgi:hypothetical protein
VCLLPVAAPGGAGRPGGGGGVVDDALAAVAGLGPLGEYRGVLEAMNRALAGVLDALGFSIEPLGQGGATLGTGRRDGDEPGAAR